MLFSQQSAGSAVCPDASVRRQLLLTELLTAFQRTFPTIQYQIFIELNLLNAQAVILQNRRIVRLYGGVALHPAMGRDGLAFVLLHETGHHLADGSRLPWGPMIACECVADYWATSSGHKKLSRSTGWTLNIPKAIDELTILVLETEGDDRDVPPPINGRDAGACWAMRWPDRRTSILSGISSMSRDHVCSFEHNVLGPLLNRIGDQ